MWTLPKPNADGVESELRTAFTYADGTPLYELSHGEWDNVKELYAEYDAHHGRPNEVLKATTLGDALKVAIYNAYFEVQEHRRLHNLRDRLKIAAARCPFCGIGPVTDLDHHLPRSIYKALAVYPRNLVPACGKCNNKKRANAEENDHTKQFVHAYFDIIPAARFLNATADMSSGALIFDFSIDKIDGMGDELFSRLCFQVERLELWGRYPAEINVFLCSQETSFKLAYGNPGSGAALSKFLNDCAVDHQNTFGANDWRTATLFALAECAPFCEGGFKTVLQLIKATVVMPG